MVENYQAAYLAKSPCDPLRAAQGLSPERLAQFELQERLQYPDKFPSPNALLESAEARLATFTAVGFTEDFMNSITRISRALDRPVPQPFERQNVAPERILTANLDETTKTVIRDLTEIDQRLYQSAISR